MAEGDGRERGREALVLVSPQRHGGEGSAQALPPVCQFFQIHPQNDTKAWSLSSTHLVRPSPLQLARPAIILPIPSAHLQLLIESRLSSVHPFGHTSHLSGRPFTHPLK